MSNGTLGEKLESKTGRGSSAFGQVYKVFKRKVSLKTSLRIYSAIVISYLLCGAETWVTSETEGKKVDAAASVAF